MHCRGSVESPAAKKARRQSGASSITSAAAAECTDGALNGVPAAAGSHAAEGAAEEILPGGAAPPLNMLTLHRWAWIRSSSWHTTLSVCQALHDALQLPA